MGSRDEEYFANWVKGFDILNDEPKSEVSNEGLVVSMQAQATSRTVETQQSSLASSSGMGEDLKEGRTFMTMLSSTVSEIECEKGGLSNNKRLRESAWPVDGCQGQKSNISTSTESAVPESAILPKVGPRTQRELAHNPWEESQEAANQQWDWIDFSDFGLSNVSPEVDKSRGDGAWKSTTFDWSQSSMSTQPNSVVMKSPFSGEDEGEFELGVISNAFFRKDMVLDKCLSKEEAGWDLALEEFLEEASQPESWRPSKTTTFPYMFAKTDMDVKDSLLSGQEEWQLEISPGELSQADISQPGKSCTTEVIENCLLGTATLPNVASESQLDPRFSCNRKEDRASGINAMQPTLNVRPHIDKVLLHEQVGSEIKKKMWKRSEDPLDKHSGYSCTDLSFFSHISNRETGCGRSKSRALLFRDPIICVDKSFREVAEDEKASGAKRVAGSDKTSAKGGVIDLTGLSSDKVEVIDLSENSSKVWVWPKAKKHCPQQSGWKGKFFETVKGTQERENFQVRSANNCDEVRGEVIDLTNSLTDELELIDLSVSSSSELEGTKDGDDLLDGSQSLFGTASKKRKAYGGQIGFQRIAKKLGPAVECSTVPPDLDGDISVGKEMEQCVLASKSDGVTTIQEDPNQRVPLEDATFVLKEKRRNLGLAETMPCDILDNVTEQHIITTGLPELAADLSDVIPEQSGTANLPVFSSQLPDSALKDFKEVGELFPCICGTSSLSAFTDSREVFHFSDEDGGFSMDAKAESAISAAESDRAEESTSSVEQIQEEKATPLAKSLSVDPSMRGNENFSGGRTLGTEKPPKTVFPRNAEAVCFVEVDSTSKQVGILAAGMAALGPVLMPKISESCCMSTRAEEAKRTSQIDGAVERHSAEERKQAPEPESLNSDIEDVDDIVDSDGRVDTAGAHELAQTNRKDGTHCREDTSLYAGEPSDRGSSELEREICDLLAMKLLSENLEDDTRYETDYLLEGPVKLPCKRKTISPWAQLELLQASHPDSFQLQMPQPFLSKNHSNDHNRGSCYQSPSRTAAASRLKVQSGKHDDADTLPSNPIPPTLEDEGQGDSHPSLLEESTQTSLLSHSEDKQALHSSVCLPVLRSPSPPLQDRLATGYCEPPPKTSPGTYASGSKHSRWASPENNKETCLQEQQPGLQEPHLLHSRDTPLGRIPHGSHSSMCSPETSNRLIASTPKGILKTNSRRCQAQSECPRCAALCQQAKTTSEFVSSQMQYIEKIARRLIGQLRGMCTSVQEELLPGPGSGSLVPLRASPQKVRAASASAAKVEVWAQKQLVKMARDCRRVCHLMDTGPRRIRFADEVGGRLCHVKYFHEPPKTKTSIATTANCVSEEEESLTGESLTGEEGIIKSDGRPG